MPTANAETMSVHLDAISHKVAPGAHAVLVFDRAGTKKTLTYLPRGAHGRGQTWSRVRGIKDEKCGDVL